MIGPAVVRVLCTLRSLLAAERTCVRVENDSPPDQGRLARHSEGAIGPPGSDVQRRSLSMRERGQRRALCFCTVLLLGTAPGLAWAQTAPGTVIDNIARAELGIAADVITFLSNPVSFTIAAPEGSAPTAIELDNQSVDEGVPGAVIGNLNVFDPDPEATHTFAVNDPRFEVVGNVLKLVDDVALAFADAPLRVIEVTATDPNGDSITVPFPIVVQPAFRFTPLLCSASGNAPIPPGSATDASASGFDAVGPTPGADGSVAILPPVDASICENVTTATLGQFEVPDGASFSFEPNDARFLVTASGVLRLRTPLFLNHELEPEVLIDVTVFRDGALHRVQPVRLTVRDLNEPPTDILLDASSVLERTPGATVGALTVVDEDVDDSHTFEVSDARFVVVGGVLQLAPDLEIDFDLEPQVGLDVVATDNGGLQVLRRFTLEVTPRNLPPEAENLDIGVARSAPAGTVIGQIPARDPNARDTLTFDLLSGSDGRFEVDASNGRIRVAAGAELGGEGTVYTLQVDVSDDNAAADSIGVLTTTASVRITVTESNTPPTIADQVFDPLPELSPGGTLVGVIEAMDEDGPLTFTIVGGDLRGAFAIDSETGAVLVARPELLRFDQGSIWTFEVAVTNSHPMPLTSIATITVTLLEIPKPPLLAAGTFQVTERAPLGTLVGVVEARFGGGPIPDGETVTLLHEIVAGNGGGAFAIDPESGVITVANSAAIVLAEAPSFDLLIRVTESIPRTPAGRLASEAGVRVIVVAGVSGPEVILLEQEVIAADSPSARVGSVTVIDPSQPDGHLLTVDDARFVIVAGELRLAPGVSLPPNTLVTIRITATDGFGQSLTRPFTVGTAAQERSPATLLFMKVPPPIGADVRSLLASQGTFEPDLSVPVDVGITQCATVDDLAGPFEDAVVPRGLDDRELNLAGALTLRRTSVYAVGEPVFLGLHDQDANQDPAVREQVEVRVTVSDTGDREIIRLTETGPDTGFFVGTIRSGGAAAEPFDCMLAVQSDSEILATYFDPEDASDTVSAAAIVAPIGVVFDSETGRRIDDARIRIVDDATGGEARVFGDMPFAAFPAEIASGREVEDAGGIRYRFDSGQFRFPFLPPGRYRLEVTPPNRYRFPSVRNAVELDLVAGGPYSINAASRGQVFEVEIGPGIQMDIPLDLQPIERSESILELFTLANGTDDGEELFISRTQCDADGSPVELDLPRDRDGQLLDLPGTVALQPAVAFNVGEPVFVRLIDPDQDSNPAAPDTVRVTLRIVETNETETLILRETGASTGVFTGFIGAGAAMPAAGDCRLGHVTNGRLEAHYSDPEDPSDQSRAAALIDPVGRIFDAASGEMLEGVRITLIDAATGAPATVRAADGVSSWPATVTTGATVVDGAGNPVTVPVGGFRFPMVAAGTYRYEIAAPEGFRFPSMTDDAALQQLSSAPFLLGDGSRGASFEVAAGALPAQDVPLDPIVVDLFVSKRALSDTVAVGDFIQYELSVENPSPMASGALELLDFMPLGFRYQSGSARIGSERVADVEVEPDGRTLRLPIANLEPGDRVSIRYVSEITAGARQGIAVNQATAVGAGVRSSNTAQARVRVREDLLRSRATLLGRVVEGACDAAEEERKGLAGVRLYMEDGTFVVTDSEGRWHIEGVKPGGHVVQIDETSLPSSHQIIACDDNARFAGTPFSQFVDVQGGSLWRADFHVAWRPPEVTEVTQQLYGRIEGARMHVRSELAGGQLPLTDASQVIMLPDGWRYVPGSSRIEGQAVADPDGYESGALTYRLGNLPRDWRRTLELLAEPGAGVRARTEQVQAMLMFHSPRGERVRLPVASVTISSTPAAEPAAMFAFAGIGTKDGTPGISRQHVESLIGDADADPDLRVELIVGDGIPGCGHRTVDGCTSVVEAATLVESLTGRAPEIIAVRDVGAPGEILDVRLIRSDAVTRVIVAGEDAAQQVTVTGNIPGTGPETRTLPPIPALPEQRLPTFSGEELAAIEGAHGIVWPEADFLPRIRAVHFAVKHPLDHRAEARINGIPVSPLLFDGVRKFEDRDLGLSVWNGVPLNEGDNRLDVRFFKGREQVGEASRIVRFAGGPVRAELVPKRSVPVADGIEAPIIAIRLYDRTGSPVRPGMTGDFTVRKPYRAYETERELTQINLTSTGSRRASYVVREDGIAFIELQPTTRAGEVVLDFEFADRRRDEIRARLTPAMREWILVGFAEGSIGYETLGGNMVAAGDAGKEDGFHLDGRVSLFARGAVQGKYLLTLAYDSSGSSDALGGQIDPNRFYTLYGDASQQGYDAESQRKLYLRVERGTFYALFGDFDTGLTVNELGRYSRRFTGMKSEYDGAHWGYRVFGAEATQAYLRDDIRGDGTSGLYRLGARNVIANSERIRIETRDRFDIDNVIEERALTRFRDYNIDYDAGTLLFKEPIFSQDDALNPIFVVVEYETDGSGSQDLIVGGRVARKVDGVGSEVGLTAVYDGTTNNEQKLGALDARIRLGDRTEVKAELAWSQAENRDDTHSGWGYRVEAEHGAGGLNARAYVREQRSGFGIGQQFAGSTGTRRFGARVDQDLGGHFRVDSEAWQEDNLDSGDTRRIGDTRIRWQQDVTELSAGARVVRESRAAGDLESNLLTARASRVFVDGRLRLNANGEYDLGGGKGENSDFPTRLGLGGEFEVWSGLRLFGRQEYTFGDERNTEDTRIGVRSSLWSGATLESGVSRRLSDDQERIAATTGLVQNLRLSQHWRMDLGMDREQTLKDSRSFDSPPGPWPESRNPGGFNPRVPPISGSNGNDFTSGFVGIGYARDRWEATSRVEYRTADSEDRWNLLAGYAHQLDDGRIASVRFTFMDSDGQNGRDRSADARVGVAWRPGHSAWTFLDRLDLVARERKGIDLDLVQRKLINNFNANWKPNARNQLSLIWGMKYVVDDIDGDRFSGVTALYGFEYRHDLNASWDIGLHGGALHSWNADVIDYQSGLSLGHTPWRNVWISLGYNFQGFRDDDFAGAHYTAQGPFLRFRLKVDQHSLRDYLGAMPFSL